MRHNGTLDGAVLDDRLNRDTIIALAERLTGDGVPVIFLTGHDRPSLPPVLNEAPWLTTPPSRAPRQAALRLFGSAGGA